MLLMPAIAWLLAPKPAAPRKPAPRPAETTEPAIPVSTARKTAPRPAPSATASAPPSDDDPPVTGTVLDPDGKPFAGAFVGCDDRPDVMATGSDQEGRFKLPPGADGCLAVANHPSFVISERQRVVAGRDNVLRLNRGGGIEGEVVDERGAPIAAYTLSIDSYRGAKDASSPLGLVRSVEDPRGGFLWDGLAPGSYVLVAAADGRPPTRSRFIDVEPGRNARNVRIVVPRGATLTGRVLDADTRKPVAGASVGFDALTSGGVGGPGWARTDESGAYSLPGAPPGPFSIRIAKEGYTSKIIPGLVTRGADALKQDAEIKLRGKDGPSDELGGVGAILAPSASGISFGTVFTGSPAEKAGVKPGDRIRRIDGVDASTLTLGDCIQRLRGADGSVVSVQVERGGQVLDISVVRRLIAR